jgi:hypothetical protein
MAEITPTSNTSQSTEHREAAPASRYRLKLIKGDQRWHFRWDPGSEAALIERVAQLAATPGSNLDWYDAAVVCKHIANPHPTSHPRGGSSASGGGQSTAA